LYAISALLPVIIATYHRVVTPSHLSCAMEQSSAEGRIGMEDGVDIKEWLLKDVPTRH